jgi:copper chaperone CopZ
MHMIIGFVLASLLKKKGIKSNTLPSIFGKFDVVHAIPGRIRYLAPLLEDIDNSLLNRIEGELSKIDGIKSVHVNPISGSLILTYDDALIKDYVVHGIVLKLLGLEKELDYSPESTLLKELKLIGRGLDHQIHKSSAIGFKIKFWARPEGGGCIVIRRRPITQSKTFILMPIASVIR